MITTSDNDGSEGDSDYWNRQFVNGSESYLYEWTDYSAVWTEEAGKIGDAFNNKIEMGYIIHPEFMTSSHQLPANLFVRPAYKRLMANIWESASGGLKNTLLTGTPGIGQYSLQFVPFFFHITQISHFFACCCR